MTDYKAMYLLLFNAVTDALEKMDRQNYGEASALLIAAQQNERQNNDDHKAHHELLYAELHACRLRPCRYAME